MTPFDLSRLLAGLSVEPPQKVTPLYMADPYADERDLLSGEPYLKMVEQDVRLLKGWWIAGPPVVESEVP